MPLAGTLRKAREDADLSQRDFAARVGFTASYICDLEKGRRRLTPELEDAYRALGWGAEE